MSSSTFTVSTITAGTGLQSSSVTVAANTKELWFVIALDNSNSAANNVPPSEVSWNSVNASLVDNTVIDSVSPFGQCMWLYKIIAPTPGTGLATVNHSSSQFHHQFLIAIVNTGDITTNVGVNTIRGTGTSTSLTVDSSNGDDSLFFLAVDSIDFANISDSNGTLIGSTGGASRQSLVAYKVNSSGMSNTENFSWTASQRYAGFALNVADGVHRVDSINGSSSNPTINVAGVNTALTTGMGTITGATISDGTRTGNAIPNMPSGDGSFSFTWPYADGDIRPLFDVPVTAKFTDGTRYVSMAGTYPLPSNYNTVTWLGATNISPYHLGSVLTLTDGNFMHYENAYVSINQDGSMSFILGTTFPYVINGLLQDATSGVITRVIITVASDGAVISVGGLTVAGLTTSGLTTAGITRAGL